MLLWVTLHTITVASAVLLQDLSTPIHEYFKFLIISTVHFRKRCLSSEAAEHNSKAYGGGSRHLSSLGPETEQMAVEGGDPLEGPSWLFASIKKKKWKSSVVRKLSCILSDMGSTTGNSSVDNSDLELQETCSTNGSWQRSGRPGECSSLRRENVSQSRQSCLRGGRHRPEPRSMIIILNVVQCS